MRGSVCLYQGEELGLEEATLEEADHLFGPSKSVADEYVKGQHVMDKMGDYRNVSALISFFQAIGAPFASFAGIASKAVRSAAVVRSRVIQCPPKPGASASIVAASARAVPRTRYGTTEDVRRLGIYLMRQFAARRRPGGA